MEEKFYLVHKEEEDENIQEACFLMKLNVGPIKVPKEGTMSVGFSPAMMATLTRQSLLTLISKRPNKERNVWEDKITQLIDALVYWSMMAKLGFTELPIAVTPEGDYTGHPLCATTKNIEVVDYAAEPSI